MPARGQRIPIAKRFASKFTVCKKSGCWIWTSGKSEGDRYGLLWFADGRSKYAHRVSYEIHNGPIPDGAFVCHKCDNGLCVNPAHLFIGTAKENYDDMVSKGRGVNFKYEKNPAAKLNWEKVEKIRSLKDIGLSQESIARQFAVSRGTIKSVLHGRTWIAQPEVNGLYNSVLSFGG